MLFLAMSLTVKSAKVLPLEHISGTNTHQPTLVNQVVYCTCRLTTVTLFPHFLLLVDRYSKRPFYRGIAGKSTAAVIAIVREFQAPSSHPFTI
jgi:hypothetical protein